MSIGPAACDLFLTMESSSRGNRHSCSLNQDSSRDTLGAGSSDVVESSQETEWKENRIQKDRRLHMSTEASRMEKKRTQMTMMSERSALTPIDQNVFPADPMVLSLDKVQKSGSTSPVTGISHQLQNSTLHDKGERDSEFEYEERSCIRNGANVPDARFEVPSVEDFSNPAPRACFLDEARYNRKLPPHTSLHGARESRDRNAKSSSRESSFLSCLPSSIVSTTVTGISPMRSESMNCPYVDSSPTSGATLESRISDFQSPGSPPLGQPISDNDILTPPGSKSLFRDVEGEDEMLNMRFGNRRNDFEAEEEEEYSLFRRRSSSPERSQSCSLDNQINVVELDIRRSSTETCVTEHRIPSISKIRRDLINRTISHFHGESPPMSPFDESGESFGPPMVSSASPELSSSVSSRRTGSLPGSLDYSHYSERRNDLLERPVSTTSFDSLASLNDEPCEDARLEEDLLLDVCSPVNCCCASISSETLRQVLTGEHHIVSPEEILVVDCRYPYEYDGGHIENAINVWDRSQIEQRFWTPGSLNNYRCIIFHCEFSSQRAPRMWNHLRNWDRKMNQDRYPSLYYPQLYILRGGYKEFFEANHHLCNPAYYVRMTDPSHIENLRSHKSHDEKSWKKGSLRRTIVVPVSSRR